VHQPTQQQRSHGLEKYHRQTSKAVSFMNIPPLDGSLAAVTSHTIERKTHVCWSLHTKRLARKISEIFLRSISLCTRASASRRQHAKSFRRRAEHRGHALESFKPTHSLAIEKNSVASAVDERCVARSAENRETTL